MTAANSNEREPCTRTGVHTCKNPESHLKDIMPGSVGPKTRKQQVLKERSPLDSEGSGIEWVSMDDFLRYLGERKGERLRDSPDSRQRPTSGKVWQGKAMRVKFEPPPGSDMEPWWANLNSLPTYGARDIILYPEDGETELTPEFRLWHFPPNEEPYVVIQLIWFGNEHLH